MSKNMDPPPPPRVRTRRGRSRSPPGTSNQRHHPYKKFAAATGALSLTATPNVALIKSGALSLTAPPNVATNNMYDPLADDDDGSLSSMDGVNINNSNRRSHRPTQQRPKKPALFPPIVVQGVTIQRMQEHLKNMGENVSKNIILKITADTIKLLTSDKDTYTAAKKFCTDNNITGFTYTPKQDRYVKFCMYGLWEMPINQLSAELSSKNISPVLIKQLALKEKRYDGEAIYLLYFKRSQNIRLADLRNITGLFNVVTRFQYYKNKEKEPTQCSNCQQFGHGTQNCFRPAACVRCAGAHKSKECIHLPVAEDAEWKIPDDKVKCVLCNEKHTANYRQCKARKSLRRSTPKKQLHQRHNQWTVHQRTSPVAVQL